MVIWLGGCRLRVQRRVIRRLAFELRVKWWINWRQLRGQLRLERRQLGLIGWRPPQSPRSAAVGEAGAPARFLWWFVRRQPWLLRRLAWLLRRQLWLEWGLIANPGCTVGSVTMRLPRHGCRKR